MCFLIVEYSAGPIQATVESCTASVSPNSIATSIIKDFNFTLTNTGSSSIVFFRVTAPSTKFSIWGYSAPGWNWTTSGSSATFTGGSIPPGSTLNFSITIKTAASEAAAADWKVEVNDVISDVGLTNCTGSLSTAISGITDITPPVMSETITISDISSSSVKISWTTDEATTSVVYYGTTANYGSIADDKTLTTAHSVTISSLTANTTYYYYVESADSSGNTVTSFEQTFVTAAAGVTSTLPTTTTVKTTTSTSTESNLPQATPTPKPLVDTIAPSIFLEGDFDKPFKEAPKISGKASDSGAINVGVALVEYSIDDGRNWLPVDDTESVKGKASSVKFEFTPTIFEDGNYKIKVRAKDLSGNLGYSGVKTMVIDRLPPQVGGSIFSIGPQILSPNKDGIIFVLPGMETKITLSSVGGATEINIISENSERLRKPENQNVRESDTLDVRSSDISGTPSYSESFRKTFPLIKNLDSGLWSGILSFNEPGIYTLLAKSVDGADNKTERKLNTFVVLKPGKVIKNATISVYYFEPTQGIFVLWDGKPYGQVNPQITQDDGSYKLFLPAGKYYLQIQSPGYKTLKTNIFTLDSTLPINSDFELIEGFNLKLGPITIPLPNFEQTDVTVDFSVPVTPTDAKLAENIINKEFPQFSLVSDLRGKATVVTFLNSWSPLTAQQLAILEKLYARPEINLAVIFPQESNSVISIFQKRGEYKIPLIADPDGILVEELNVHSLPAHYFLDRKGVVGKVKVGVLTEAELLEGVVN